MTKTFRPSWTSPPGDTLLVAMEEKGLTKEVLADLMGFPLEYVNDLIHGQAVLTEKVAECLEAVVGASKNFWLHRESQYREALVILSPPDEEE